MSTLRVTDRLQEQAATRFWLAYVRFVPSPDGRSLANAALSFNDCSRGQLAERSLRKR